MKIQERMYQVVYFLTFVSFFCCMVSVSPGAHATPRPEPTATGTAPASSGVKPEVKVKVSKSPGAATSLESVIRLSSCKPGQKCPPVVVQPKMDIDLDVDVIIPPDMLLRESGDPPPAAKSLKFYEDWPFWTILGGLILATGAGLVAAWQAGAFSPDRGITDVRVQNVDSHPGPTGPIW